MPFPMAGQDGGGVVAGISGATDSFCAYISGYATLGAHHAVLLSPPEAHPGYGFVYRSFAIFATAEHPLRFPSLCSGLCRISEKTLL
jgi:hypothetical protein